MTRMLISALCIAGLTALAVLGALAFLFGLLVLYMAATWEGHGPWVWPGGLGISAIGLAALLATLFMALRSIRSKPA